MTDSKLLHDMNSKMSSISQALPIVKDALKNNPDQAEQILDLCIANFDELLMTWTMLKDNFKE